MFSDQPDDDEHEQLARGDCPEAEERAAAGADATAAEPAESAAVDEPLPASGRSRSRGGEEAGLTTTEAAAEAAESDADQDGEAAADVAPRGGEAALPEVQAEEVAEDEGPGDKQIDSASAEPPAEPEPEKLWFILKVQVNREDSIREALIRRFKVAELEEFFGELIVPTEEVAEFNKSGKRRIVRRKLYPGYILVNMVINEDTWFLVRETPGVGDFTGSAGRPTPMDPREVERILRMGASQEEGGGQIKTAIPFKTGDRVRVKDGNFQNFEGEVDAIDEANGRITVMINIFNRSTPVELEHWQVEAI